VSFIMSTLPSKFYCFDPLVFPGSLSNEQNLKEILLVVSI